MSDEFGHGSRISAVETEVQTIRSEMGGLKTEMGVVKADVKGLGAILGRIEQGILRAQDQDARQKLNPVAVVTVIITVLSMLVGGAWIVGGSMARQDATVAGIQQQLDRIDARMWEARHGNPAPPQ